MRVKLCVIAAYVAKGTSCTTCLSDSLPTSIVPLFRTPPLDCKRLGDVTNSASSTRLNDHLGTSGSNPCGANKKEGKTRPTPVHGGGGGCESGDSYSGVGNGIHEMAIDVSGGAGRGRTSSRRASSRTGQTPQRQTVAARTRSRVSLAPATSLRGVR